LLAYGEDLIIYLIEFLMHRVRRLQLRRSALFRAQLAASSQHMPQQPAQSAPVNPTVPPSLTK
jgi:hypothetical protein